MTAFKNPQRQELMDRTEHNLTLHPPEADAIAQRMDAVRTEAKVFASAIIAYGWPSRELSLALTELEACTQHVIASIARNQDAVLREDHPYPWEQ